MGVLLSCQSIAKSYGTRPLFEGLTFGVNDRERLGLIGPNGSGKSTLLRILAGIDQPDSGTLSTKRQLNLAYVPQEDTFEAGANAEDILIAVLQESNVHLDEHERINRAETLLERIGFADDWRRAPVETLSGGWRKRVAIARELIREPDLLLMDEPTNHLDLEGILWLEKLLSNAQFASVMVSHDRVFLENAANRIFELNRCYPDGFYSTPGLYSDFLLQREQFLSGQMRTQQTLESKVRRESEWLKRGPPGRTTKARARIDEAGRLIGELAAVRSRNSQDGKIKIDFISSERQTNKLLVLKNVHKSMGERKLIGGLEMILTPGIKLGLLGPNGSGKTTFLRLLAGELQPDAGTIKRAEFLRVVYFDQSREQLDKEVTLRRALAPTGDTVMFRDQSIHVSSWAKRFLFKQEQLEMPVKSLSGGEQGRILIARLMLRPADLLLLDEPTNDLDIPSLEVLEESLADFPGAMVLVTHDRYMLRRLATDILGLDGKGGADQFTDYTQWENARERRGPGVGVRGSGAGPSVTSRLPIPDPRPSPPAVKRRSYKEQREWDGMEAAILAGEARVQAIQKEVEDPQTARDPKVLHKRFQELAEAQATVDALYARWQELGEKRE